MGEWEESCSEECVFSGIHAALAESSVEICSQAADTNNYLRLKWILGEGSDLVQNRIYFLHPPVYKVFFLQVLHGRGDLRGHVKQHHGVDLFSVALSQVV